MQTFGSWREIDDAIGDRTWGSHPEQARPTVVFRGLARRDFSNVTSLARLDGDYPALERHLLRNFRKYAHQRAPGPTTWDWLALGQHHGLPTRLLDWTFSPLVALHFATATWPEQDAVLWSVDCARLHDALPPLLREMLDAEGSLVFTTEQLAVAAPEVGDLVELQIGDEPFGLFFEPPTFDERIASQAAVLSVMSDPACELDSWLTDHPGLGRAWRIPAALKVEVRRRLDQAQINERSLMPGLDGLAAWLRRYYSPQRDASFAGASMTGSEDHAQEEGSMS
ncbi:MAG TPA: FRG domain-containing protein [Baekduia sp.]